MFGVGFVVELESVDGLWVLSTGSGLSIKQLHIAINKIQDKLKTYFFSSSHLLFFEPRLPSLK